MSELEAARSCYFAAGGVESDIGPRDTPSWYWRRAALLLSAKRDEEESRTLSFSRLREVNARRCSGHFHPIAEWSETDWACAVSGEEGELWRALGELCNLVKKRRRAGGPKATLAERDALATVEACADEMAEIIYLDLLAAKMGIDLGEAVRRKFNVVSERVGSADRL